MGSRRPDRRNPVRLVTVGSSNLLYFPVPVVGLLLHSRCFNCAGQLRLSPPPFLSLPLSLLTLATLSLSYCRSPPLALSIPIRFMSLLSCGSSIAYYPLLSRYRPRAT